MNKKLYDISYSLHHSKLKTNIPALFSSKKLHVESVSASVNACIYAREDRRCIARYI